MAADSVPTSCDTIVIGAGQAGLAAGYHLRESGRPFLILDSSSQPGGAWPHYYDSLRLFSPRRFSSLPGLAFPGDPDGYPTRDETTEYLRQYSAHFDLPFQGRARVISVCRDRDGPFEIETETHRHFHCRRLIVATGSFRHPNLPHLPGHETFKGCILHSMDYRNPSRHRGRRVVVVGGGNSAVQIAVELAAHARVTLATRRPIRFLPQRVLGRDIHFWLHRTGLDRLRWGSDHSAPVIDCARYREALAAGRPPQREMFNRFTPEGVVWDDGTSDAVDEVIFATGFQQTFPFLNALPNALPHRRGLSLGVPGLAFVGLSGQTGLASATLRGVGRDAAEVARRTH